MFSKRWRSKFESRNKCFEVESFVDATIVVKKFFDYFSKS